MLLVLIFGGAVGVQVALRQTDSSRPSLLAQALRPAKALFPGDKDFSPADVEKLLETVSVKIVAPASGAAAEPDIPEGVVFPVNEDYAREMGIGSSPFLVDSRWATIRYLGESPAGAGLQGAALNAAQKAALGKKNDTIPVVTTAVTINRMMDGYFAPLLQRVPGGRDLLPRIKVQGAYFSPTYSPRAGESLQRDNAFVVGLQSLTIYPSSCFDEAGEVQQGCVQPFYSTGHDPTVMGHELGHVIFNHLRGMKSLEGFEWFAVNEGYSDYFTAAYFDDPRVGRIWKVDQQGAPYLRRLLDDPVASDERYAREVHAFSIVFSSSLWRARARLAKEQGAKTQDFDRVVLFSIPFLGETEKTRLGDAATAMLRSAEALGFPEWKTTLREEFDKAEITLKAPSEAILARRGADIPHSEDRVKENGCGVIAAAASAAAGSGGAPATSLCLVLPALAAVWNSLHQRRKNRRAP